jgi:hypothetical protein
MPGQLMPMQPTPQYQPVILQPSAPAPKGPSTMQVAFTTFFWVIVIFVVVMFYRFVRAAERIADKIDKVAVIRKEDTPA